MAKVEAASIRNLVVVSDIHAGSQSGLCPPGGVRLDTGARYKPNRIQRGMWRMWESFWREWVPRVTRGEPYAVAVNGDAVDGRHHDATDQIAQNLSVQAAIAYEVLAPIAERAEGRFYMIRGTEAHVGPSAEAEEQLAQRLGAARNEHGQSARYELWVRVGGTKGALCHLLHHVGTTSSAAYESSAVNREMTAEYVEAARWNERPPDYVIRSHRHRAIVVEFDSARGYAAGLVTPGWQAKTPFAFRTALGRISRPQFGGLLIRQGDEEHYFRRRVWHLRRGRVEVL